MNDKAVDSIWERIIKFIGTYAGQDDGEIGKYFYALKMKEKKFAELAMK